MGRSCKGICILHVGQKMSNRLRYEVGHKRCSFCGVFMDVVDIRCPCCGTILRTKPRNKRVSKNSIIPIIRKTVVEGSWLS